jgi:hypothetical protein
VPLDLFNDVFLLHFPLKSPEGIFQGFAFLESYFCQNLYTSPPSRILPAVLLHRVLISYGLDFESQALKLA